MPTLMRSCWRLDSTHPMSTVLSYHLSRREAVDTERNEAEQLLRPEKTPCGNLALLEYRSSERASENGACVEFSRFDLMLRKLVAFGITEASHHNGAVGHVGAQIGRSEDI